MSKKQIRLIGDEDLVRNLRRFEDETRDALGPAVLAGAELVAENAGVRAPRRSGYLATHMVAEIIESNEAQAMAAAGPEEKAFWGFFQELGTRHHPAQPFLRPALDENADRVAKTISDALRAVMERAGR